MQIWIDIVKVGGFKVSLGVVGGIKAVMVLTLTFLK